MPKGVPARRKGCQRAPGRSLSCVHGHPWTARRSRRHRRSAVSPCPTARPGRRHTARSTAAPPRIAPPPTTRPCRWARSGPAQPAPHCRLRCRCYAHRTASPRVAAMLLIKLRRVLPSWVALPFAHLLLELYSQSPNRVSVARARERTDGPPPSVMTTRPGPQAALRAACGPPPAVLGSWAAVARSFALYTEIVV